MADPSPVTVPDITAAARTLADGGLVAFPTETVYGLGADATSAEAVARIFTTKGRPDDHPLIVHIGRRHDLDRFGSNVSPDAAKLADAFWPGPLTIIVDRGAEIAPETTGGRDTVGIRMPDHPLASALLGSFAEVGSGAVAAPSANRFGEVSPTTADHVRADLGDTVDVILDGGPCRVGVESTIVELTGSSPVLLRPGGISAVEIEAVLGHRVLDGRGGVARAPGMLESHYAPDAEVILLDAEKPIDIMFGPEDGLISTGTVPGGVSTLDDERHWRLPSDAAGYARGLYATLRAADVAGVSRLFVVPPVRGELLGAVMDRLGKAAVLRT